MKWAEQLTESALPQIEANLNSEIIKNMRSEDSQILETSAALIAKIVNKSNSSTLLEEVIDHLEMISVVDGSQTK